MDFSSTPPGAKQPFLISTTFLLAAFTVACGVVSGCNKDTQAAAELPPTAAQPTPQPGAATPTAGETTGAKGQPAAAPDEGSDLAARISDTNFEVEMKPAGEYASGKAGTVELVLLAKGAFKVNEEYPYKFKPTPADGVKFASDVVRGDAIKLEKTRAVMTIEFTPESAGKKQIAGQFSFSVCTDERCLIEKRDIALDVDVK